MKIKKLLDKNIYKSLGYKLTWSLLVALFAVIAWESSEVREPIIDFWNGETIVVERATTTPNTIEGLVDERADAWLKSPEAKEYARNKVTEQVIDDLSKL